MAFLNFNPIANILLGVTVLFTSANAAFNRFYNPLWGFDHFKINPQGTEVQLLLDKSSGAGFRSKSDYGSGLFHIRMKIPEKLTGGVNTNFYLTSAPDNKPLGNHFELDFEFLGTNGTVQTNVYDNDGGHREESFKLWFNPSQDFHTYGILWNPHLIVFFVDGIPIREFKNNKARGVDYPSRPMHIEASIWYVDWAGPINWSLAPFIAYYQDFNFEACPTNNANRFARCSSDNYRWNMQITLSPTQKQKMRKYRKAFMSYTYCAQRTTKKQECSWNNI